MLLLVVRVLLQLILCRRVSKIHRLGQVSTGGAEVERLLGLVVYRLLHNRLKRLRITAAWRLVQYRLRQSVNRIDGDRWVTSHPSLCLLPSLHNSAPASRPFGAKSSYLRTALFPALCTSVPDLELFVIFVQPWCQRVRLLYLREWTAH